MIPVLGKLLSYFPTILFAQYDYRADEHGHYHTKSYIQLYSIDTIKPATMTLPHIPNTASAS